MNQVPLVSVYIPTRNRAELAERAVLSVLKQTYRNLEVIVVIDGSIDHTQERLEKLAAGDSRLRIIARPAPGGAPAARNLAIHSARGEFITGLDDDDLFLPHRIELFVTYWEMLRLAGAMPVFLYAQDLLIDGEGMKRCSRKPSGVDLTKLCEANCIGNQVFTTRTALLDAGLFDEALPAWQDMELWMRLIAWSGPGHLLDAASMLVRDDQRADRITHSGKHRILDACEYILHKHRSLPAPLRQALFGQYLGSYYGFEIKLRDLLRYLLMDFSIKSCLKLGRLMKWRRWYLKDIHR